MVNKTLIRPAISWGARGYLTGGGGWLISHEKKNNSRFDGFPENFSCQFVPELLENKIYPLTNRAVAGKWGPH